ncbi:hypothetical protein [Humibacillus xanthopallidus]|uniref:hypothetical protein n=1 Tax=Humibacillus xanthopallidus TaxID=412689 RepID=UPI00384A79BC
MKTGNTSEEDVGGAMTSRGPAEASVTSEMTVTRTDGAAVMAAAVLLLEAAADRSLSLLAAGPASGLEDSFALSDLGLGARLAAGHARSLLPADVGLDDVPLAGSCSRQDDPIELVQAAEALTRTVPIEALPAGSSRLVVALCDLLREHADARP